MSTLNVEAISHPTSGSNATINGITPAGTNQLGLRNLIINGAMQVAQRGTSVTSIPNGYNTADRWNYNVFGTTAANCGTFTQSISAGPTNQGFANALQMDCTTAGTASADNLSFIQQIFEGQNVQHLRKGTANALQATLSFWVNTNVTGTYTVNFLDNDNTRVVGGTYSIAAGDSGTWVYRTITFPADTTGTLDDDNNASCRICFNLHAGSNYTSGTLPTAWETLTDADRAAGQTAAVGSSTDDDWQITGVQLEVGSVATPFEHRSFGDEFARCQRYYEEVDGEFRFDGNIGGTNVTVGHMWFCQTRKRATPTVSVKTESGSNVNSIAAVVAKGSNGALCRWEYTSGSSVVTRNKAAIIKFESEL